MVKTREKNEKKMRVEKEASARYHTQRWHDPGVDFSTLANFFSIAC